MKRLQTTQNSCQCPWTKGARAHLFSCQYPKTLPHCLTMLKVRRIFLYLLEVNKISNSGGSQALKFQSGTQILTRSILAEPTPFAQYTRCICSGWHWLLFVKSAISSFCIQLQDHELQQSKLEVCKAHLTITSLSHKWIKHSLKEIVSSTFENTREHGQSSPMMLRVGTA